MDNSFIGSGWSFPPSFSRKGCDVDMVSDEEDVRQSLGILLSTRLGERTLLSDFGSNMDYFLFEELNQQLINHLSDTITEAILHYEPRIRLENVEIDQDKSNEGVILITIRYLIKAVNSRFNLVYPFYLKESTRL